MSIRERENALERASEFIFSMGLGDAAAEMSILNMRYGMAKMHWVLEDLGYPADATFIGTPDLTVTRNEQRWNAGIGYGGKLTWGPGDREVVFLDIKPNGCGMLVGGLQEPQPISRTAERLFGEDEGDADAEDGAADTDDDTGADLAEPPSRD